MNNFALILIGSILVNNFILSKFMGICPFLGVSKKIDSAIGMSAAVIFVMVMATAATYPLYTYLLVPFKLEYLRKVVFILVIALFVQIVEIVLKRYLPPLYKSLGVYLPLITTNCAVLGVTLINIDSGYGFVESILNSLGGGIGFMLALVIFAGIREKLENSDIPNALKGMPSTLIAASIVSVSFVGFNGVFGIG